ncbi:hypothetical protein [Kribbella sp. CA-293567]|uniref:hypothetical protein n=1 Tax=Kribbella sp. CA-293567 TaxID=3002436 RepID=UPI0022DE783E|nr:hypothetical protein [Kribbella sp. CA-293567]WBQ05340.1 hypothetical protein OX958_00740 [Kribbella sp. CA-293567]
MADLGVGAVSSYLSGAGWTRSEQTWNGAAIWTNGAQEVLVPPRDGLGDSAARLKDLLRALEGFESRPADEIARDIAYPLLDTTSYRAPAVSQPDGFVRLESGLEALQGLHDLFRIAAQTVLRSQHFAAGSDALVTELLSGIHLGTTTSQQFSVTLLVPLGDETSAAQPPPGRRVLAELYGAAAAVRRSVARPASPGIDSLPESVSPGFCTALSTLAAPDGSFELGFRWARGLPSPLPDGVMGFPPGSGPALRDLSEELRGDQDEQLPVVAAASRDLAGPVSILGRVEALHDNEIGTDRWRVKVRGALRAENRPLTRRVLWVRLPGQAAYDEALSAHRNHQQVQIDGLWTAEDTHRVRIIADPDGLRILENP